MNPLARSDPQAGRVRSLVRLYNLLQGALLIFGWPWLPLLALPSKRRATLWQRLWLRSPPGVRVLRRAAKPIWLHAMSVGEVVSALPLAHALRSTFPERPLVVSAATATGLATAHRLMAAHVTALVPFPLDLLPALQRAVRAIDPAVVLFVESDLWPGMLLYLQQRRVPAIWLNARLSVRSQRNYLRAGAWTRTLFAGLRIIGAQSRLDVQRLMDIGIDPSRIEFTGNIKFDQTPPAGGSVRVAQLRERLSQEGASSAVIVAGSTHAGEETLLLQALTRCRQRWPHVRLILAPRQPQRAAALCQEASAMGCTALCLTELERMAFQNLPAVIVIDGLGLLQELYTLAQIAVVGGSLLPIRGIGGHNPLEPAICAKPILFGPHMDNFRAVARLLCDAGAAWEVRGAQQLGSELQRLLENPRAARRAGEAAATVMAAHRGAVAASVALVRQTLGEIAAQSCAHAVDSPAGQCY